MMNIILRPVYSIIGWFMFKFTKPGTIIYNKELNKLNIMDIIRYNEHNIIITICAYSLNRAQFFRPACNPSGVHRALRLHFLLIINHQILI